MKIIKSMLAAAIIAGSGVPVLAQAPLPCPHDGPGSPLALHEEWIMVGWEREEGAPESNFASRMGRFYDLDHPEGVFWDNFAPGDTQLFFDAWAYGANWEDLQNGARTVLHGITDANHALVGTMSPPPRLDLLAGWSGSLARWSRSMPAHSWAGPV